MAAQNYRRKNDSGPSSSASEYDDLLNKIKKRDKQIEKLEERKRRDTDKIANLERTQG